MQADKDQLKFATDPEVKKLVDPDGTPHPSTFLREDTVLE